MSYTIDIVSIFISSPSDVGPERRIVLETIAAWNERNSRSRGVHLAPLTWENSAAPDFGESAQGVINSEIDDDYDVFLGIMWSRFGTPTSVAGSGTEEEFQSALTRKESGDQIRISFFFKKSAAILDEIDLDQLKKVREFKKSLSGLGGLYREFIDDKDFVNGLTILFDKISSEKIRYAERNSQKNVTRSKDKLNKIALDNSNPESDGEIGLFDIQDKIEKSGNEFQASITSWTKKFEELNTVVTKSADELNENSRFGRPDQAIVRKNVSFVSQTLRNFSEWGNKEIGRIERSLEEFSDSFQELVKISVDFQTSPEEINSAKESTIVLIGAIETTKEKILEFVSSIDSLPRMSKDFNVSRKMASDTNRNLAEIINSSGERFRNTIIDLENFGK